MKYFIRLSYGLVIEFAQNPTFFENAVIFEHRRDFNKPSSPFPENESVTLVFRYPFPNNTFGLHSVNTLILSLSLDVRDLDLKSRRFFSV